MQVLVSVLALKSACSGEDSGVRTPASSTFSTNWTKGGRRVNQTRSHRRTTRPRTSFRTNWISLCAIALNASRICTWLCPSGRVEEQIKMVVSPLLRPAPEMLIAWPSIPTSRRFGPEPRAEVSGTGCPGSRLSPPAGGAARTRVPIAVNRRRRSKSLSDRRFLGNRSQLDADQILRKLAILMLPQPFILSHISL